MAIVALTESNFESIVSTSGIVLVDCWASWCGACQTFQPIYEKIAARHPAHTFGKIDTQAEKTLVTELGVEHIPTLLLYRDGILLFKQPGYYEEEEMDGIVRQAESIDMAAVRAQMESDKSENGPQDQK
ncbi:thioredoxin family protein [Acidobacteriota bacterium]